jgi:Pentapeptide repeats (8 copies)
VRADPILALVIVAIAAVLLALWKIPELQVRGARKRYGDGTQLNDLMKAENDRRVTLAQIVGGTAVLAGLYFTALNFQLQQQAQITDRINKAVDQLDSRKGDITLGGIYQIARIARDSPSEHWPMLKVLTSYVQRQANLQPEQVARRCDPLAVYETGELVDYRVQAVADVLRERDSSYDSNDQRIIIVRSNLRRVDFSRANLKRANLVGNDIQGGVFKNAALGNGADLSHSLLDFVNFTSSDLSGTNLSQACLVRSELKDTDLTDANLQGADLRYVVNVTGNFAGANLDGADLRHAELERARGLTARQLSRAKIDCDTVLPPDLREVRKPLNCSP